MQCPLSSKKQFNLSMFFPCNMAEPNHSSPCLPLMSFIVELQHCSYKTFINDDAKYLFKFLEVQSKTNFFCRDVKSISSTNTGMNICLKFNGAHFLQEEERSLHSRLTGNSVLSCALSLLWNQHSKVQLTKWLMVIFLLQMEEQ